MKNHSRMPCTLPCSALKTPHWQVPDDSTRITVKNVEYGMFRCTSLGGQLSCPVVARIVKYIANSAAKNISSDDSQTMVPIDTMLGRVSVCPWGREACGAVAEAVVTRAFWQGRGSASTRGCPARRERSAHLVWGRGCRPVRARERLRGRPLPPRTDRGDRGHHGRLPVRRAAAAGQGRRLAVGAGGRLARR